MTSGFWRIRLWWNDEAVNNRLTEGIKGAYGPFFCGWGLRKDKRNRSVLPRIGRVLSNSPERQRTPKNAKERQRTPTNAIVAFCLLVPSRAKSDALRGISARASVLASNGTKISMVAAMQHKYARCAVVIFMDPESLVADLIPLGGSLVLVVGTRWSDCLLSYQD